MLKAIDPILSGDLLKTLRDMGHGDELVVVDSNFPSFSIARTTKISVPLMLSGVSAPDAVRAILSLMPLDSFVPCAAWRMEVVGDREARPAVQAEVQTAIDEAQGQSYPMGSIERHAFYERAKAAYAVVTAGENRHYGCFIFKKGVIAAKLRAESISDDP